MKTLELRKASKTLADYAANLGAESIVVTSNKKPVAALVSLQDVDRESLSLSLDPAFLRIIRPARAEVRRGDVYSLDQVKREMLIEAGAPKKALHRTRRKPRLGLAVGLPGFVSVPRPAHGNPASPPSARVGDSEGGA